MLYRGRMAVLFLSMAALLIVSVAIGHEMGRRVLQATDEVAARHAWSARLSGLVALIRDAESGQRGFIITGRENYLRPYETALPQIDDALNALKADPATTSELEQNLVRLNGLIRPKLKELADTIALRQTSGFASATQVIDTDFGMNVMFDIRQQAGAMATKNEALLTAAQQRVRDAIWRRDWVRLVATIIDLTFLAGIYLRLMHDRDERDRAAAETYRQKELLAVTLASIGDAVMVTDVESRITFVNKVAESLLLRPAADCIGKPCGEIFRIINEQTRQSVESPVAKVIETGTVVGLANHTLLIRPDGSELPIDDAGAPVREADGTLRGVVLIFRDFTAHRDAAERMQRANADLAAAVKAKDNFIAMISHELRTPLTPVVGTLQAWEESSEFPACLRDDLGMARWNVELEARLIDDLLDMTRLGTGKLSIEREALDLHATLRAVVNLFEREFASRQLHINLQLNAQRFHVSADTARMHQVFWNILKNAAKFTPKGGDVTIISECGPDNLVRIHFKDSGIGMTAETLGRIFRPLEQGGAEITRRYGGLGLGMAISRSLVEAQNGTLVAQSAGIGGGSTFSVSMPTVDATAAAPAPQPTEQPNVCRPLNILLVEDHADTATVIRLILRKAGHQVDIGGTVQAGLDKLGEKPFDLLLSDLGLPDGTGLDLIRQVRQNSQIPAIALTGYGMDDDIARCRDAGFNRHLTKPVNFQQLMATIRELIPE